MRQDVVQGHSRAVAAGTVSLVSTRPFSLTRGLLGVANYCQCSADVHTSGPQAHRWRVETCKIAANHAKDFFQVFLPTTFHSSKRTISLRSLICEGCGLRDKRIIGKPNCCCMTQSTERVDICRCETLSYGLWEASYLPKNALRCNLIAFTFQNFPGDHAPGPP